MQQSRIQTIMRNEISRQDFLKMSLFATGSILGFGTFIRLLMGKQPLPGSIQKQSGGYGDTPYGK